MKKKVLSGVVTALLITLFVGVLALAASGSVQMPFNKTGVTTSDAAPVSFSSKSYVKAQVDTVVYTYLGESVLSFGVTLSDSGKITNVIMKRRTSSGVDMATIAGDTLTAFSALTSTGTKAAYNTITLSPVSYQYVFYVTYDTTTALFGVTSPTVKYEVVRAYGK